MMDCLSPSVAVIAASAVCLSILTASAVRIAAGVRTEGGGVLNHATSTAFTGVVIGGCYGRDKHGWRGVGSEAPAAWIADSQAPQPCKTYCKLSGLGFRV